MQLQGFSIKRVPSPEALGVDSAADASPTSEDVVPAPVDKPQSVVAPVATPGGDINEDIEQYLVAKILDLLVDKPAKLDVQANFMELGVDSNQLIQTSAEIERELQIELYPTLFFEYQNTTELVQYFAKEHRDSFAAYLHSQGAIPDHPPVDSPAVASVEVSPPLHEPASLKTQREIAAPDNCEIAVIGMAGRVAGAKTLREFWDNLRTSKDMIREIPGDHWDYRPWFDPQPGLANKTYSKWGSFLDDIDKFDPSFFGIPPVQARWFDPQLRIFLEVMQETIEDACYGNKIRGTNSGVFVGCCFHEYWDEVVRDNTPIGAYEHLSSAMSSLSGFTSYTYDLQGASIPLDNACASSLTAFHLACRALQRGECEMAFVGGLNVLLSPLHYVYFSQLRALSPTGRCYTFDEAADGYVPGEGVLAVLLKPLEAAIAAGDKIHAIVKGSAINHVGRANNPSSPRPELQTKLLLEAWRDAGIDPETLGYIETHGTGTKLGDPIEINALKRAFAQHTKKREFCHIGSTKAHIGHLEGAAGIAGVIKTILSMQNGQIPQMPNFKKLNPFIQIQDSPLLINEQLQPWQALAGQPRRAGVSSFGMTGNNAHVVLEEYRTEKTRTSVAVSPRNRDLFLLSAKDDERLSAYVEKMLQWLPDNSALALADIAYTSQVGREHFACRLAIVCQSLADLESKLREFRQRRREAVGIYYGDRSAATLAIGELEEDRHYLRQLVDNGKLHRLAQLWVMGSEIAWQDLRTERRQLSSLPSYPFASENYWRARPEPKINMAMAKPWGLHPLLDSNQSTLAEQRFAKAFSGEEFYLRDHKIHGIKILPGVAYLEMVRAAGELANPDCHLQEICDVVWANPLTITNGGAEIAVSLHPNGESVGFEVRNTDGLLHSQGKLRYHHEQKASEEKIALAEIRERTQQVFSREQVYETLHQCGLDIGEQFQAVSWMRGNGEESLARLQMPQTRENFALHPSLLDGALQTIIAFHRDEGETIVQVPFSLDKVEIFAALPAECYAYTRRTPGTSRQIDKYDIQIAADTGEILLAIAGFAPRPLPVYSSNASTQDPLAAMLFQPLWKPQQLAEDSAVKQGTVVLVYAEQNYRLAQQLAQMHAAVNVVHLQLAQKTVQLRDDHWQIGVADTQGFAKGLAKIADISAIYFLAVATTPQIVDLASVQHSQQQGIIALFRLCKELDAHSYSDKSVALKIVVNGTQQVLAGEKIQPQAAGLLGLGQVIAREYRQWRVCTIDFAAENFDEPALATALVSESARQPLVAWRDGQRYVRQIESLRLPHSEEIPLRERGVYLIVGGSGGIGFAWSRHLAQQYQARLVWIGRRPQDKKIKEKIAEIAALGGEVLYCQADVTDPAAMDEAVANALVHFSAIHGAVHSAVALHDMALRNMTEQDFCAALPAKIEGSVILQHALRHQPLDFFLLFSSAVSFWGNPGQSNYSAACTFQDSFAHYLASANCPAKVINWGYWGSVGVAADEQSRQRMQRQGILSIEADEGIATIARALAHPITQLVAVKATPQFMQSAITAKPPTKATSATPTQRDRSNAIQTIAATVSAALQLTRPPAPDMPFADFGVDSILALEIIEQLNQRLAIELKATDLFSHTTIEQLATYIDSEFPSINTREIAPNEEISFPPTAIPPRFIPHSSSRSSSSVAPRSSLFAKYREAFRNYSDIKVLLVKTSADNCLEVLQCGKGQPLVLLPPINCLATAWKYQVEEFSRQYQVLIPHYPGIGQSELHPQHTSLASLAQLLVEVLDPLTQEPWHLVGWSMGGFLAQQIAIEHPQHLRTLALLCTASQFSSEDLHRFEFLREDFDSNLTEKKQLQTELSWQMLKSDNSQQAYDAELLALDLSTRLSEISLPALIIAGGKDRVFPAAKSEAIHQQIQGSQYCSLKSGGHYIPLFHSKYLQRNLAKFWRR